MYPLIQINRRESILLIFYRFGFVIFSSTGIFTSNFKSHFLLQPPALQAIVPPETIKLQSPILFEQSQRKVITNELFVFTLISRLFFLSKMNSPTNLTIPKERVAPVALCGSPATFSPFGTMMFKTGFA
ncbi:MAG: hypothetical protein K9K88_01550 [Desulfobacterales bacterium]|nr:hypothetical protein [Desulfobacterales bacterium]